MKDKTRGLYFLLVLAICCTDGTVKSTAPQNPKPGSSAAPDTKQKSDPSASDTSAVWMKFVLQQIFPLLPMRRDHDRRIQLGTHHWVLKKKLHRTVRDLGWCMASRS